MNGLSVSDVRAAFGKHVVLDGVSLSVEPGETMVLFGASGAGKTVLLRAIAGLEPAAFGRFAFAGQDITTLPPERRNFGVAFQNFALYPHMPARENIASPLRARGLQAEEIERRVAEIAALLRIGHVLDHAPRELSNGQKQRTALARALVGRPRLLLLDDPLRNVDAKLRYEMRTELPRLLREAGAATIYVSQDFREAMALGDRIAVLIDGKLAQVDTAERVYDQPANVAVARLFGDPPMNLTPCRSLGGAGSLVVEWLGQRIETGFAPVATNASLRAGIRPESLRVSHEPVAGAARAELLADTPVGERRVLLLRTTDSEELLASTLDRVADPGDTVYIAPDRRALLIYDAESGRLLDRARDADRSVA